MKVFSGQNDLAKDIKSVEEEKNPEEGSDIMSEYDYQDAINSDTILKMFVNFFNQTG